MVSVQLQPACIARSECSMPASMVCPHPAVGRLYMFNLPLLAAGSWSYQLFTNNTWGPGGTSDKTGPVSQRTCASERAKMSCMSRKGRVPLQTEVLCSGCWPALGVKPIPATPPTHAALSNDSDPPVIQSLERGATVATLRFRKPAAMSDQDDLVYRAQVG